MTYQHNFPQSSSLWMTSKFYDSDTMHRKRAATGMDVTKTERSSSQSCRSVRQLQEVHSLCVNFKFLEQGQRETPVADASEARDFARREALRLYKCTAFVRSALSQECVPYCHFVSDDDKHSIFAADTSEEHLPYAGSTPGAVPGSSSAVPELQISRTNKSSSLWKTLNFRDE